MNRGRYIGLLGIALVLAVAAARPAKAEGFELTPQAGFRLGGSFEAAAQDVDLDLDESAAWGVVLGFPLDDQSIVEVELVHQGTELQSGGLFSGDPLFDVSIDSILAGGRYQSDGDRVRGFVAGGLGVTRFGPGSSDWDDEWAISLSIGGGALIQMGQRVALRLEGRGIGTFMVDRTAIFCGGSGCLVEIEGSGILQAELRAGLTFTF